MKTRSKQTALLVLPLILLAAIVLIPATPIYTAIPARDSGAFLYVGWRILNGEIPYRDVWGHKPPAIYYIDALGLFVGGGSPWGVWFLEFLSLCFAAISGFILMRRAWGILPAIFGSVAWLVSLVLVLQRGNLTEEFALPFQFAALYLFVQAEKRGGYSWRGYVMGMASAGAFFLKQSLVGVWLSIVVYLLVTRGLSGRWRGLLTQLAAVFLGAASIILIVVVYFAAYNALESFWDAAFRYNIVYTSPTPASRLTAISFGLRTLSQSGVSIIALAAWAAGMFYACCARDKIENTKPLLYVSLIGLPVEVFFASASGRSYAHYFMAWLPVFAILTGFFAHALTTGVISPFEKVGKITPASIWLFAFLATMSILPIGQLRRAVTASNGHKSTRQQAVEYVRGSTAEGDYLLMWGAESRINFLTHRRSPARFAYQYPLYESGYQSAEMIREFLQDITANKPALIIDASSATEDTKVPPLDFIERQKWVSSGHSYAPWPEMDELFDYISANYKFTGTVGSEQWRVYTYVGD